ncbi:Receptor like protein 33 [Hibiscus syriacus]|uniref:Receptor like protein 33 n=1 Tax=Hibiscus syriacus TaxID=106335 RepID=A0A6A3D2P7_HIBSY|nr:Receptor like protein 33 [Hibiscus syriacus]
MGKFILLLFFLSLVHSSLGLSSSSLYPTPLCPPADSSALIRFKNTLSIDDHSESCDGTSYPKTKSWNESTDCCTWYGVTCNKATGQVISLDLSCSKLVGSLSPNTTLFRLQGLQRLNLAYNSLDGSLGSSGLSQLVSLTHLNLSGNYFLYLAASDITSLSKLISLDHSWNNYLKFDDHSFGMLTRNLSKLENLALVDVDMSDVVVPTSFLNISSSLKQLDLHGCQLQGEFPIEIFQLGYLEYLDLGGNSLTGYLPKSNWISPLWLLDLSFNQFRGSIPASLGNLTKITSLIFEFNHFESQIPDAFGNLRRLTFMDFSNCNFSGELPSSLFNLTHLTSLDLSSNRIQGPLPTHVSGLQRLEDLGLHDNLLSAAIPSWLFTLPFLDLSQNRFTALPDQIQEPNSVQHVYLDHNDIQGEIPSFFFGLVNLVDLDLSSNNFSGVIKLDELSKLKSLEELDLSNNKLLSWSCDNGVNSTFQKLRTLSMSSCNVERFPNVLRSATSLTQLDLSNNKIQGSILKWETEGWERLRFLNLSHNLLTGFEQFRGKNLEILDLRSNQLQGHLPFDLPSSLEILSISENKLTGEIPPICNLSSLYVLDLSRNYLTGTIPACVGNSSSYISTINLQTNSLTGKIPDFCVHENDLQVLSLNDNQLEGSLPRSLIKCTALTFLDVANNKLSDTFPHWLGVLPMLQVLIMRSNGFHGPLNVSEHVKPSFESLKIVDLSSNDLTGPLPSIFFQNLDALKHATNKEVYFSRMEDGVASVNLTSKKLEMELQLVRALEFYTAIDFSNNRFVGEIPNSIGELCETQVLNLSHNGFIGHIPPSLGKLVALQSLDLSSNKLSGEIPSQLTDLTFLEVLNLSHNNLVGHIPNGKQFNTFENDSYTGNLGLCGFPVTKQCGNVPGPKPPAPKSKEDGGSAVSLFWKLVMMGYGSGVVVGISTAYIVFTTGRPWWLVRIVDRDLQRIVTRWVRRIQGKTNIH